MNNVRNISLCVFRHGTRILVGRGVDDAAGGAAFFRPLGGEIEYGETAAQAIRREIREELRVEIEEPVRLGVLENVFTYEEEPGHEIVVVFDAVFVDRSLYEKSTLILHEDVWGGEAQWLDLARPLTGPLYPDGLVELLAASR